MTGAARGLGRAIAETLAAAGAKVACVDVNAETLAETVAAIRAAGGTAEPLACDVTDSQRVNRSGRRSGARRGADCTSWSTTPASPATT